MEVCDSDLVGFGHMSSQDRRVEDRSGCGTPLLVLKQSLRTSRKGYKGHVTRIRNEIEALMVSRAYESVRGKLANLESAFSNLRRAHEALVRCLDDPEEIFETTTWFEDLCDENRRFIQRVEKWLDGSQWLPTVDANNSVSDYGSSSVSRKASSRLTVKVKEAKVEEALVELKLQQLKKKFDLQRRREAVQREEELLEVESEIEQARLRVQILEEGEGFTEHFEYSYGPPPEASVSRAKGRDPRTAVFTETEFDVGSARAHAPLPSSVETNTLRARSDLDPVSQPKHKPTYGEPDASLDRGNPHYCENLEQLLHQQQQMIGLQQKTFQSMASTIKQGFSLPKPDISKFDGNPLDYWNFVRSFENSIARNASNDNERLSYLLQFCTGTAREVISSCSALDPAYGYQTARALLEERFGHPYKIATAHLNRVVRGPSLKPYDQRGLLTFADQLRDCQNVLESIGYLNEINSADNLRSVVERLPFHLRIKWLEVADRLRESGLRPRIHHISEFVSKRARAVNDPVFGNIIAGDREKTKKSNKPSSSSRGTTFAAQGGSAMPVSSSNVVNNNSRSDVNRGIGVGYGKCVVCAGLHQLWNCDEFKRKSYADRMNALREHRLCDNCFKVGHIAKGCLQKSACYVEGCNKKHMTVIHPPTELSANRNIYVNRFRHGVSLPLSGEDRVIRSHAIGIGATSGSDSVTQHHANGAGTTSGAYCDFQSHATGAYITPGGDHGTQSYAIGAGAGNQSNGRQATEKSIRLRVVPVKVHDSLSGRMLETYALLDNGSDISLCDSELVKELGLQGERRDFFLTTQEKRDSTKSGLELKLTISSLDGASTLEIPRVWSVDCLNISSRSIPVPEDVKEWPHLSDIELPEIQGKDVRLLIGCNAPEAFWVLEERRGARGEPIAVRSILGWTLMGPVERISGDSSFNVNFVRLESGRGDRDEALLQQVEKFWKTDFVDALCSSKVAMSVEDQKALKTMEDSVKIVSGHYQVALPWRNQPPYLPNNRIAAEQRLQLLRKRFSAR